MAAEDETCIAFHVSESGPSRVAAIFLVVVHPLAGRSSYNDLERLLKRLDLRRGECVYVCLHILPTCPRAVAKNANKLCARHVVVYHDAEYPVAAAARALAGVELHPQDFVVVLRDVLPDADFIDKLVATVARLPGDVDLLTLTPSTYVGFAASASLLSSFCVESPVLAAHPDADILLQCYAVGSGENTRALRAVVRDGGQHLVAPLGSYFPVVTVSDRECLDRVLNKLCLHVSRSSDELPALQQMTAAARTLLRRNAAAHLRCDVPTSEALAHILHGRHLGIVNFVRRLQTPSITGTGLLPAVLCDLGLRRFAEQLHIRVDDDKELKHMLLQQFPELSRRLSELTRRAVKQLATTGIAGDNVRSYTNSM